MKRLALVVAGLLVLPIVFVVEVLIARTGVRLPPGPGGLDGVVGPNRPGAARKVVWIGDSISAGEGVDRPRDTLPHQVAERMAMPVDLTVLAVSGARIDDLLSSQVVRLAALEPDMVFIDVGANDVVHLTKARHFRASYERLLAAMPDGAEVVVLGVPDMGAPTRLAQPLRAFAGWRGRRLDREARAAAAEADVRYVDIEGETGPAFRSDPERYFARDHYHPSAAGYTLWADAVLKEL